MAGKRVVDFKAPVAHFGNENKVWEDKPENPIEEYSQHPDDQHATPVMMDWQDALKITKPAVSAQRRQAIKISEKYLPRLAAQKVNIFSVLKIRAAGHDVLPVADIQIQTKIPKEQIAAIGDPMNTDMLELKGVLNNQEAMMDGLTRYLSHMDKPLAAVRQIEKALQVMDAIMAEMQNAAQSHA